MCVCSLLLEDGENPSLADLRLRIQEGREGGMIKRTVMFEEALCTMRFAANPYNWPEDQRFKYRLGILEEVSERTLSGQEEEQAGADQIERCLLQNEEVPVLLSEEDERRPLYEVMNPVLHDVVIVPVTQTDRDGLLHVASSSSSKDHTPDS